MTMRIEHIAASPDRAGRYTLRFEDGSVMRLYRQTVEDFGLYAGMEMDDDGIKKLRTAAGQMSARMRAVRIVSASSISKGELQRRLVQKGEDPDQAREAVQWMCDLSLVDDAKTAEQIVSSCIRKGYGLARAKQALYEKRIPKAYWEAALADYPEQADKILEFLRARLSADADEKAVRRAVDALIRRGHHYGQIRKALEQLKIETEEFPED
ncbi:MAG: regulatory protein RecX [Oscillospiraceae bacterium]|nr:regulatory protein RecX [Oscillospiraceae bacterium]